LQYYIRETTDYSVDRTYIFNFDSLGYKNAGALERLSWYLRMEAKYKKGIEVPGIVEGRTALVKCPFMCPVALKSVTDAAAAKFV
jgi:hypothetical protein